MVPQITKIERTTFTYPLEDVATNQHGYNLVYDPGSTFERETHALRVYTDDGITGAYVGGNRIAMAQLDMVAEYLLGENPLEREKHWTTIKRALRKYDQMGIGPIDIALWDIAGKKAGLPIHQLLGTYRTRLPTYASTYFATETGGFTSPEVYADFAATCRDMGYGGFKIHPWSGVDDRDLDREIKTVRVVGERVGDDLDLMYDPVCEYETFADALAVGNACDEQNYYWYEDPYSDGGSSQHGHRQLRNRLKTPLLQTELIRGLEAHTDFVANEATDYLRADVEWDGGITGAMKIANVAEGFGIDVEFHLAGPATRHCMAATRNSNYYELGLIHPDSAAAHNQPPVYRGEYTDDPTAISDDGTFPVPDGPGLGVEYAWDYITDRATEVQVYE